MVSIWHLVKAIMEWTPSQEKIEWIFEVDCVEGKGVYWRRNLVGGTDLILPT